MKKCRHPSPPKIPAWRLKTSLSVARNGFWQFCFFFNSYFASSSVRTHVCEWWWSRLRSFGNSNWVWICMFHARLSFVFEFWTHRNTNIYVWNSHHSSWIYNWHKSWRILGPIFKELFGTAWPFLETSLQNLRRNSFLFLQQQLLDELFSWTKWFSTSSRLTEY